MAANVPADPSGHLLVPAQQTPLSFPRADDNLRREITPRAVHQDEPVPIVAPGGIPPNPVPTNIANPPAALMNLMLLIGLVDPIAQLMGAQALQLWVEHLCNRTMNTTIAHLIILAPNRLHQVYNTFTKGFLAYLCYCIARRSWNTQISVANPTVALLQGYNNGGLADAERFGRYIVLLYPQLDQANMAFQIRLSWDHPTLGIKYVNLEQFFNNQVRRLRAGGIHSAAWIAGEVNGGRRLLREYTYGLLYQHVLVLGRITERFDELLGRGHRWYLTNAQQGEVANLDFSKIY